MIQIHDIWEGDGQKWGFIGRLLILFPSRHTVSLLSGNPIVPFRFCFLAELMKENKRVMLLFPGLSI